MPMNIISRRQAIKTTALASAACAVSSLLPVARAATNAPAGAATAVSGPFALPPLPYAFDALEPYLDARTMEIHHAKHHGAYVANLNKAIAPFPELGKKSIEDLLAGLDTVPESIRTAVRNQGGGHYNHSLFWQMLKKDASGPEGGLAAAMDRSFGGFGAFKEKFAEAAGKVFGSGWVWLVPGPNQQLSIESTPNQDSPVSQGKQPLLGIDVWEHAYYLKYQNRRAEYVAAFFHVINWDFVAQRYAGLTQRPANRNG
jgi:superoxide dismutase, Fe-Mn family